MVGSMELVLSSQIEILNLSLPPENPPVKKRGQIRAINLCLIQPYLIKGMKSRPEMWMKQVEGMTKTKPLSSSTMEDGPHWPIEGTYFNAHGKKEPGIAWALLADRL